MTLVRREGGFIHGNCRGSGQHPRMVGKRGIKTRNNLLRVYLKGLKGELPATWRMVDADNDGKSSWFVISICHLKGIIS